MQRWSMMVLKRKWVLVHSSSHGHTRFTLLSFSLRCAFSFCDLRCPSHLVWAALFKTRITIAIVCLILWDHTPTESTFSQMQSRVQLHSHILSERQSEGTGNPGVKQSVVNREQLCILLSDWQRLSVNILSTVREKIIHFLWQRDKKSNQSVNYGAYI